MVDTVELGPDDAEAVCDLYVEHEWWADRDPADVERALANTDLAVGLRDGDALVASARVLTDFVYYARVHDIIVARSHRGEGLGCDVLDAVTGHESLADVDVTLSCREGLVPFYERCGFEPLSDTLSVPGGGREPRRWLVFRREERTAGAGE